LVHRLAPVGAIAASLLAFGELGKQLDEVCVAVLVDEASYGIAADSATLTDDRESRGTHIRQCKGAISRHGFVPCCDGRNAGLSSLEVGRIRGVP
jgi:hypothetical protein